MNAATQTPTIIDVIMTNLVVDEETARANAAFEADRKADRDARKLVEIAHRSAKQQREAAAARAAAMARQPKAAPSPMMKPRIGVIIPADPAETARIRAENDKAEAERLAFVRRQAAERTYDDLVGWLRANPAVSELQIGKEFMAALFLPLNNGVYSCEGVKIHVDEPARIERWEAHEAKRRVLAVLSGTDFTAKLKKLEAEGFTEARRDDRGNAVYARGEVTVVLYGSSTGEQARHPSYSRLTPEQQKAADRRAALRAVRPFHGDTLAETKAGHKKPAGSAGMTAEEMEARRIANAATNAAAKLARKAKAKAPKVKTPKKADADEKAKKGGKKK